jgi:type I restriction enzyme, S subunit
LAQRWCRPRRAAKFSAALRCLIRPWRALEPWIAQDEQVERASRHALARLGDVLARHIAAIDKTARPIGELNVIAKVTFGGVLHLRSDKGKTNYKGPLFEALPGQLIISKIRVGQGSFCVLSTEHNHVAVSPEYPVYQPDLERLDVRYLALTLRASNFLKRLAGSASGNTTKRRITPAFFESLSMPLPPLSEQRALVAAHDAALTEADALKRQAVEAERAGADAFAKALGLEAPPPPPDRPQFIARFQDLDRWSPEAVLRRAAGALIMQSKWPIVSVSEIGRVSYGMQKHPGNRPGASARPYLRVANVQRNRLDLSEIKFIDVPESDMERYRLMEGDLLLCEGNSPDLVGRGAIWRAEIANCVHQNHVLRVRLQQDRAIPEFVLAVINSGFGQAYFRSKSKRTTNLASINSKEVAGFSFTLPPLETQRELVAALEAATTEATGLVEAAKDRRAAARAEFETAIYASAVVAD